MLLYCFDFNQAQIQLLQTQDNLQLCVFLQEIKLAISCSNYKIVLQVGGFGRHNVVALKHCSQVRKMCLVLFRQRRDPAMFGSDFFNTKQFFSAHSSH